MKIIFLSLLSGFILGCAFKFFRLPLPAPPSLAGITGIVGIYLGHIFYEIILKYLR
ncbi:XapX domain-containing protein [Thermohalobacter berrensis]|uniref:XapX domain containing protein n=1 Tax=Thermohalobacter berrensis TaxID=99594 RepID=A0A419T153_9FIRM|nr:XapX domain-containing protein [Thermohalobacter berrensis]RKD31197.1 XapX domain containing protein [Thermohalobacter berrensis]